MKLSLIFLIALLLSVAGFSGCSSLEQISRDDEKRKTSDRLTLLQNKFKDAEIIATIDFKAFGNSNDAKAAKYRAYLLGKQYSCQISVCARMGNVEEITDFLERTKVGTSYFGTLENFQEALQERYTAYLGDGKEQLLPPEDRAILAEQKDWILQNQYVCSN